MKSDKAIRRWCVGTSAFFVIPLAVFAQTNSWINPTDGSWQDATNWSLSQSPSNTQLIVITNDLSKTVTIDGTTSSNFPSTLTITNLILSAPVGATNTLSLFNAGTNTPLIVLNTFTLSSGGALLLTGSALSVQCGDTNLVSNGVFSADGNVVLGTNSILVADSGMFVGSDTNAVGSVLLDGGQLFLTNGMPSALGINGSGQITLSNGTMQIPYTIFLVGAEKGSQGTLTLAGGNYSAPTLGRMAIGTETGSVGTVSLNGGNLLFASAGMTLVGGDGSGQLNLLSGSNSLGPIQVAGDPGSQGTLSVTGGTNIVQNAIVIAGSPGATGTMWMTGGQLIQTNSYLATGGTNYWPTYVGALGTGFLIVSNGTWIGGSMVIGSQSNSQGDVVLNGGTLALCSGLTLGTWSNAFGEVQVNSGTLYVTNANSTASLVVGGPAHPKLPDPQLLVSTNYTNWHLPGFAGRGVFMQDGGTVTVDRLVMTNGVNSVYSLQAGTFQTKATFVMDLQTVETVGNQTNVLSSTIATNPQTFVVGDGVQSATYRLLGGVHAFITTLQIRSNSFLTGCGTLNGDVVVDPGATVLADCGGTLTFNGTVTNNGTIRAFNGTTLESYGTIINNGFIDAILGTTNFHAGVINNGIILDANGDYDGDGMSNLQEYLAGTDPTNSASVFRINSIVPEGNDLLITWSTVTNKTYVVQVATNSLDGGYTNGFSDLATVTVPASPLITQTNYLDVGAVTNGTSRFYRIRLGP